eukprot:357877-Chlamydomonas_euryale.AAC.5
MHGALPNTSRCSIRTHVADACTLPTTHASQAASQPLLHDILYIIYISLYNLPPPIRYALTSAQRRLRRRASGRAHRAQAAPAVGDCLGQAAFVGLMGGMDARAAARRAQRRGRDDVRLAAARHALWHDQPRLGA